MVVLATAFITPWLHYIPRAALAAVIICAVIPNIDFTVLNKMWKIRKGDIFPYIVTFLSCIIFGIEYGVLIGIFVSVGLILFPIARPTVAVYQSGQEIIVTPYGNIHFPAIGYVRKLIVERITVSPSPGRIVIDGTHWTDLDYSVAARMKTLIKEVEAMGWEISFSEMSEMISGMGSWLWRSRSSAGRNFLQTMLRDPLPLNFSGWLALDESGHGVSNFLPRLLM